MKELERVKTENMFDFASRPELKEVLGCSPKDHFPEIPDHEAVEFYVSVMVNTDIIGIMRVVSSALSRRERIPERKNDLNMIIEAGFGRVMDMVLEAGLGCAEARTQNELSARFKATS